MDLQKLSTDELIALRDQLDREVYERQHHEQRAIVNNLHGAIHDRLLRWLNFRLRMRRITMEEFTRSTIMQPSSVRQLHNKHVSPTLRSLIELHVATGIALERLLFDDPEG